MKSAPFLKASPPSSALAPTASSPISHRRPRNCSASNILVRLALKAGDQARRVPAPAAHRLNVGVEIVNHGDEVELDAVAFRLLEHERQILAHPIDREAEVETALDHGFPSVFHL